MEVSTQQGSSGRHRAAVWSLGKGSANTQSSARNVYAPVHRKTRKQAEPEEDNSHDPSGEGLGQSALKGKGCLCQEGDGENVSGWGGRERERVGNVSRNEMSSTQPDWN